MDRLQLLLEMASHSPQARHLHVLLLLTSGRSFPAWRFLQESSAGLLEGSAVAWFYFLRRSRTFNFSAEAVDGSTHDIEIQSVSASSALGLAQRLCATKNWMLIRDPQCELGELPLDPAERFQRLARLLDERMAKGSYRLERVEPKGNA